MKEESPHFIPIGPFNDFMIKDEFSFEDVRTVHCVASVSRNICSHLVRKAEQENKRYLTICIPAYNEEFEEMLKTLISLMENIEFMKKKASQYKEFLDVDGVVEEFKNTIPIIVPIFDGTKAISKSMSAWLEEKFPHLLDDLKPSPAGVKPELDSTDVRIVCSKWWYLCDYEEREAQQKRAREGKNVATGNAAVDDMLKSILLKYEEHRQARRGNHDPQFIPSNHVFLEHEREEFEKELAKSASTSSNHGKPTSAKTAPLTPKKSQKADDFQGDDLNMSTTTFNDSFEETKEDSYDATEALSGLKVREPLFKTVFSSDRLSDNLTPRSTSENKTPTQTIRIPLADFQNDSYVDAETLLGYETGSSSGSEHSADLDRVMHDMIRSGSKLSLQSHLLSVSPINDEARQHLNAHEEEGGFLSPEFLQGSVNGDNRVTKIKNKFGEEIPSDSDRIIQFYLCPIVKRSNHRKHNSHQWFFDAICDGLEDKTIYALLTDCGTSYAETCVGRLMVELYRMPDLIGVTARQRVETPNRYFHPCLDAPYAWMQGEHAMGSPACWKCWLTYLLSPCPLQGIEFEGSVTISLAMFNLVEALPVMPGPCQLMQWQKMKEFHVVDEYFNLLFEGENEKIELPELPPSLIKMKTSSTEYSGIEEGRGIDLMTTTAVKECPTVQLPEASKATMTFAEFLRTNMRLAEDRILTFVSVFSTGYGTKWVLGSTFYYQPEIQWNTLLTQRRRWTNGTFAGFLFSFVSPRAKQRILGGMFDAHKPGKSIKAVYILWSLQVIILCYLFFSPAVFGAGSYKSLVLLAYSWPEAFHWAVIPVISDEIRVAEVLVVLYLVIYAGWSIASFYAPRGKISEWICQTLAIYCAISVLPMYISIWRTIVVSGVNVIGALVLINLFIPVLISIGEDIKSAVLYLLYLPWLLSLVMFFIVFFPSYSFARLWDTTWGNRAGGKDSAVNDSMESYLKSKNFQFILLLIGINIALTKAFVEIFSLGYAAIITFMMVAFFPMLIQIIGSSIFLFIIWPLRKYIMKPFSKEEMERKEEEEKEKKREEEEEKKRLEERKLALSSSSLLPSSSSLRLTSVTLSSPSRELDLFTARYNEDDVVDAILPRLSKA